MFKINFVGLLTTWGLLTAPAIAQVPQPANPTLPGTQQLPPPLPTPLPSPVPVPNETPPPPSTPEPSTITFPIRKVEVIGGTLLNPGEIQRVTQAVEGKTVTLDDLRNVADAITQIYLSRGYITSRAIVADQTIANGIVQIQVIEGSIERIEVQGLERLRSSYVSDRLKLGTGTPLNKDNLEDQLRLLKFDPLFESIEASLRPGSGVGQSILTVRAKEAKSLNGFIGADNFSPPTVGSDRIGTFLSYRNLTGRGDAVSAAYYRSLQGGSNSFDFAYRLPVNAKNGTVQLRIAPGRSEIIEDQFTDFGIRSKANLYELSYRQPLIRTPREEFALSAAFAIQNGQTFLFQNTPFPFGIGPDNEGNSRTRVLKFGQDYIRRDSQGAWAARSQLSFGLNLCNATANSGLIPDGQFFAWLGQVQRVQRLGTNHLLIAQADVQLTPNSLLPSQQFVIGGGQALRGYRQNARSGDNGFRVSFEDRITVQKAASGAFMLQIAPFLDFGSVWNRSTNPNLLPTQRFLSSAGLGLILEPTPGLTVRLDYAIPFMRLSDRGENAQDRGFYFSVGYGF